MIPANLTLAEIRRVIAAIIFRAAERHLQQGIAGMVEEITVMRDDDRRAVPLGEIPFQPFDRTDVEMIGRLVK